METLEDRILKEISMDEIYQHIKFIVEIGQKIAGSNEEKKFVNYVTEILKKYGVEFKVYEFEGYVSEPIEATLRITYPEEKEIPCSPYAHGASTPPEGIEGELVYVGSGGLEDYRGKDVKGKVTLAELSYAPPRPEKVRIAQEMGAIAQIQINWGLMEKRLLPMGTVKSIWGNPTPEDVQRITRIAAVGVTKSDGAYLKELLKRSNKVKVWLKTQVWKGFRSLHDIIAEVPGKEEPNRFVLVNGHYDCWGPGATDNAVGNATMLELARVFNLHKNELRRGVKFAWWSGHESGIMVGSTWYVDNFWDELNKGCIAWLNIDSIGMRGTDKFWAMATEGLHSLIRAIIKEVDGREPVDVHRLIKVGDQSALGMGVPSLMAMTIFPEEEIIQQVGRYTPLYLGWWYHGTEDTIDKIDIKTLEKNVRFYALCIIKMCNSLILPYNFTEASDVIKRTLEELNMESRGLINLHRCLSLAEKFDDYIKKFQAKVDEIKYKIPSLEINIDKINDCLIKMSRIIIPILYTYDAGKYGQDPYGLSYLNYPIPVLQPIKELVKMDIKTDDFIMLRTKLIRKVNEVSDNLERLIEIMSVCESYIIK